MNLSIPEAVWLASASMTYEVFYQVKDVNELTVEQLAFKQSHIQKRATQYTVHNVDSARISQWCNADHLNPTYNYFRNVNKARRLAYFGEFKGVKEIPEFNIDDLQIKQLVEFVKGPYTEFMKKHSKPQIELSKIINHLKQYANKEYADSTKVNSELAPYYIDIGNSGNEAVSELNKLSELFEQKYGLYSPNKTKWLNGSNTIVRGRIWNELKCSENETFPASITVFADKRSDDHDVRLRVVLNLNEKNGIVEHYAQYQKMLEYPFKVDKNYCYYINFKDQRDMKRSNKNSEQMLQALLKGEITKVEFVYELYAKQIEEEDLSNDEVLTRLVEAFGYIKEFHDIVVESEEQPTGTEGETLEVAYEKNMILYGPPGTGKTYNTALYAVAIIEKVGIESLTAEPYKDILVRYKHYKAQGQIQFTTFHQSYGYEEFIEGIKPVVHDQTNHQTEKDIQYEIVPGTFKSFCEQTNKIQVVANDKSMEHTPRIWKISLGGSGYQQVKEQCFKNEEIRIGWPNEDPISAKEEGYSNDSLYYFYEEMNVGDIVFSLGDQKHIDAIGVIMSDAEKDLTSNAAYPHVRKVEWFATNIAERIYELNNNINLVQQTIYELTRISIEVASELIAKHAKASTMEVKKKEHNYVFIIDEINRGNISKILGELITLIEPSKRLGAEEAMTLTLPYSKQTFGVPDNVHIIGTMNTADRSIALMDTALRRRFHFVEIMPNSAVLQGIEIGGIDIAQMVETINRRIEVLYDREHMIGHAYFVKLIKNPTLEQLAQIFKNAIIPLLQEYFYEDYYNIQLILGDNAKAYEYKFIIDQSINPNEIFNGNIMIDIPEVKYKIQTSAFQCTESYIGIYR
ncbi:5-methylcytosine-specific restriction enzyme B [Lysinibacillus sphaericus]|nr:5-methylcytosine-specific restriction enzyme B [Lysinibacillus sphaericus]